MKKKLDDIIVEENRFSLKSNTVASVLRTNAMFFLIFIASGIGFFAIEFFVTEHTLETVLLKLLCPILCGLAILVIILFFCCLPLMFKEIIIDENGVSAKKTAGEAKILKWDEIHRVRYKETWLLKKLRNKPDFVFYYSSNDAKEKKLKIPYIADMKKVIEKYKNIDNT